MGEFAVISRTWGFIKMGWRALSELNTAIWVFELLGVLPASLPTWLGWENAESRPYLIALSLLLYAAIFLCVLGYYGYRTDNKIGVSEVSIPPASGGTGGPGGSGTIFGNGGTIIGGKGGDAGVSGVGGAGGGGDIHGDNGLIVGGDGGNAGTADGRGGRRTMSPGEQQNLPSNLWQYGYGGAGGNAPEYNRRLQILIKIRSEYKQAFPDDVIFIDAGIDQVSISWVNKRLDELGENWHIARMSEGGYEMPPLEPQNRPADS